jgi:single-stranded-DNA-specific exonuclease
MDKRWNILTADEAEVNALSGSLKINRVLCRVLAERGIATYEEARHYFRPRLDDLHDPWLMKDRDKAVTRILAAFERKEKILVFGDYDVDGTTSVACMYRFLCKIHDPSLLDFYIPHRYREGYGISKMGIDFAGENDFTLVISLDCGIKSVELIRYAGTLGIDFIVCDHHLPDEEIPPAAAILNPKQKGCGYPYKELCGCGVGFKLITALAGHFGMDEAHYHCYLDLVATAIAADIVPITGENRILAWYGLEKINTLPNPGIRALIKLGGLQNRLSINNVVFVIAPRVNAAGRMDDARKAVQLFIEDDEKKAMEYAEMLHSDNSDRKEADSIITGKALEMIASGEAGKKTTVVFNEHWHKGVVGIVASRLIETHYKPTVVLTRSGDIIAGSARSVAGFNLYEAVHACRAHLLGYGGHFAAAGLSMLPEQLGAFTEKFEEVVSSTIDERLLVPEITIDAELGFSEITRSLYGILCQMEPFGPGNMRPVFMAERVQDTGYSKIVKEQHVRFSVKQGDTVLSGIGFNLAGKFGLLKKNRPIDLAYTLDENEWQGNKSLQLRVIDLRPSAP